MSPPFLYKNGGDTRRYATSIPKSLQTTALDALGARLGGGKGSSPQSPQSQLASSRARDARHEQVLDKAAPWPLDAGALACPMRRLIKLCRGVSLVHRLSDALATAE